MKGGAAGVGAKISLAETGVPAVKAGAIYNYFFIEHDLSKGIHNTNYAQDLLHTSLEVLRNP